MQIRSTATAEDRDVFVSTVDVAFGHFSATPDENGGGVWWAALEPDRCLLAFDADGRPVGTTGSYAFELTLPGELTAPAAGITAVGVVPTHRRRGVLTAMMRHQLGELRARGEFLSVLLATSAEIYGRFGYGPATHTQRLTVPRHRAAFAAPRAGGADSGGTGSGSTDRGSVEVLRRAECGDVLEAVYDRYRRTQPGALSRPPRWWALGAGQPPVAQAPRYIALHRDAAGVPDGYASYARNGSELTVDEIVAVDDTVYTALAGFALGHDLVTEVLIKHFPPEHPLRWRLADFNAGQIGNHTDWLWVRLLDVPRALTARAWSTDGELVLDVTDPFLGEHDRYLLTVRDGKADCAPTTRAPDLSLDVRDLGSLYLGGTTPSTLVRAGHVRAHHAEAAALADAFFRTDRIPHCLHWF
ncbi:GNAT family N-acetyltransferase [Streptacidiphilus pinicola]|uniref:GNAT family N-acetyltransferase n=1 Tax=Streptacidiphilus pinicola TaxID=2219663 RepID=A0A2X0KHI2_9ACTN|nr:GNAT family N-acetyltransferase [Streptacidiphilus pinicola]RAG86539.1 GNAT family N-acetyltransferase [Streptacidiphilus pinicola]